jgi:hypothetical protein
MIASERLMELYETQNPVWGLSAHYARRINNALPELAAFVAAAVALRDESTWQTRPAFDAALAALTAKLTPR